MNASPAREARPLGSGTFAPFAVRSFRFQWPADLLTSWAYEMELLILSWYVLVETDSVLMLTLFGALAYMGTLLAPFFGVAGDRLGRRTSMCAMRAFLALVAATIMTLALLEMLRPVHVFPLALLTGLVRPSDLVMRNALIGDTIPSPILMGALGLSRTTMDTARIAGALAGAGLFAALGMGRAYIAVAAFYAFSFLFTLGVSRVRPADEKRDGPSLSAPPRSAWRARWRELVEGLAYVRNEPAVLGIMALAFLVNLTAFPITNNLMPYVAREIYAIDATGLSHMVAALACGALVGSIVMAVTGGQGRSSRFMIVNLVLWYVALAIFARTESKAAGLPVLFAMGMVHSLAMVSMSGVLLRAVSHRFRARVMGIRMLCVYGVPIGLLASGPAIARIGYPATATVYVVLGIACTALIAWRWRRSMWQ